LVGGGWWEGQATPERRRGRAGSKAGFRPGGRGTRRRIFSGTGFPRKKKLKKTCKTGSSINSRRPGPPANAVTVDILGHIHPLPPTHTPPPIISHTPPPSLPNTTPQYPIPLPPHPHSHAFNPLLSSLLFSPFHSQHPLLIPPTYPTPTPLHTYSTSPLLERSTPTTTPSTLLATPPGLSYPFHTFSYHFHPPVHPTPHPHISHPLKPPPSIHSPAPLFTYLFFFSYLSHPPLPSPPSPILSLLFTFFLLTPPFFHPPLI